MISAILLGCKSDGNAGVVSGGGVVAISAHMNGTRGSGVLARDECGERYKWSVCHVYVLARGGVGGVGGERVT